MFLGKENFCVWSLGEVLWNFCYISIPVRNSSFKKTNQPVKPQTEKT